MQSIFCMADDQPAWRRERGPTPSWLGLFTAALFFVLPSCRKLDASSFHPAHCTFRFEMRRESRARGCSIPLVLVQYSPSLARARCLCLRQLILGWHGCGDGRGVACGLAESLEGPIATQRVYSTLLYDIFSDNNL